jgi:glyoxylase-like metal-dependent hydrolase (beta-lactamase superfamily II)
LVEACLTPASAAGHFSVDVKQAPMGEVMRWSVKAAILLFGATAAGPSAAMAAIAVVDVQPFTARAISPEVHLLSTPQDYYGPAIGNVSIIEQQDGFVVVDSGLTAGNGRTIVSYVRARSRKPVKAVAITHWHNDHPQGVSAIREAWPKVRIIATEETKKGMLGPELGELVGLEPGAQYVERVRKLNAEQQATLDKLIADPATAPDRVERAKKAKLHFAAFAETYAGTHVVPPTETFTTEVRIDDPATPVEIKFLGRANTAGDAVVWLPKQRIVMSGDMVVWPTPFGFFSFPGDWVQTLGKLKALGYRTLIPGHGEPQTDTAYIDQLIGSIEDIRSQVGPLARQGLSLEEVGKRVDFSRYRDLFGTTERQKTLFKAYWTDPMTENAWKEAKGLPIKQGEGEVTVATQSGKKN